MSIFKTEVKSKDAKVLGKLTGTTLKITKRDGKMISPNDIKTLGKEIMNGLKIKYPNSKLRVRGLNALQWFTLKSFADDEINVVEVEEYLAGRVKDDTKFGLFYQLELSLIKEA